MSLVSIVRTDENGIEEAVNKAIDLVDGLEYVRQKRRISIKPNLCAPKSPNSGATTDPQIVDALVRKINSLMPCEINIVETNNSKATADKTFACLGYDVLSKGYSNVRLVNLSRDKKVRVQIDGEVFSSILVPESMIFSDCLVSVAKLKTHVDYLYTGVLKNQFGLLMKPRSQYHGFMSKILADLNRFYKPDLSVIDGITGMEGFGPTDGTPKPVGVVIASKDPVAADATAARVIGIEPSKIGYLKYAEKKGIGSWKNVELVGCSINDVATSFAFIKARHFYLGRISLALQRHSTYVKNFAELVRLTRSALSTAGFSAIERRLSYSGLLRLAKDTTFRLEQ
jgi:uncharacterized protein (DUF362 family)